MSGQLLLAAVGLLDLAYCQQVYTFGVSAWARYLHCLESITSRTEPLSMTTDGPAIGSVDGPLWSFTLQAEIEDAFDTPLMRDVMLSAGRGLKSTSTFAASLRDARRGA
jgi:hypothetical protein